MQRAEAWMAEANVQREGMGVPEAGLGELSLHKREDGSRESDALLIEDREKPV